VLATFKKTMVSLFSILLGAFLGGALGLVMGSISSGLMASIFWGQGTLLSILMVGLCLTVVGLSIYLVFRILQWWYKPQKSNGSIINTLKMAIGVAFLPYSPFKF